nr:hypothetical protein KPHV_07370 [Kitasatospora purpeofusca]
MRRWVWRSAAGLFTAAGAGLVTVAVMVDLESADKVASVGGALIALVGLAVTVRGLLPDQGNSAPTGGGQTPPAADNGGGGVREIRVHAENGGTAAGNDCTAGMAGRPGRPDGDGPQPRSETRHVHAAGPGSTAAGNNIHGIDPRRNRP